MYLLTTRLGHQIRATANHKFLALGGWRRIGGSSSPGVKTLQAFLGAGLASSRAVPSTRGAGRTATAIERRVRQGLSTREVYWDEVVSVEEDGVEEVYDLTVEGLHNFVAEDVIVHNSIEQDADLVMFLYRDEYYNEQSDDQGLAEIILAKHRNGPIGTEKLAFLKRFAKFADLAPQHDARAAA